MAHYATIAGARLELEHDDTGWSWADQGVEDCDLCKGARVLSNSPSEPPCSWCYGTGTQLVFGPECPECTEPLSRFCDSASAEVSIHEERDYAHDYVLCDGCGTTFPIDGAPKLPKAKAQADGWEGIVEDARGDDRS